MSEHDQITETSSIGKLLYPGMAALENMGFDPNDIKMVAARLNGAAVAVRDQWTNSQMPGDKAAAIQQGIVLLTLFVMLDAPASPPAEVTQDNHA
jgi:hypothetical protein